MFKRVLGRTGVELSVVGFGGIICMNASAEECSRNVGKAIERGINYFDVAPSYGNAEEMLGPALEPYRKNIFLACKTGKRTKDEAWAELKASLQHLRTDYFDVYQLHGVTTLEEVDTIFSKGGAMETFLEARQQGLVRFLGFSAHSDEAAVALMNRFPFDTILFPWNWVTWYKGNFGRETLATAQAKGLGRLALKALALRKWRDDEEHQWSKAWYHPVDTAEDAALGLRFTLSKPITAAVSPGHAEFLWWACDAADKYTPITAAEEGQLEARAQKLDTIFVTEKY
ncbi:MAG: aldo/keto reductase [Chloroflexi bacterium]|nr:aldo/keto reductase [Chloroflexota bacterium]